MMPTKKTRGKALTAVVKSAHEVQISGNNLKGSVGNRTAAEPVTASNDDVVHKTNMAANTSKDRKLKCEVNKDDLLEIEAINCVKDDDDGTKTLAGKIKRKTSKVTRQSVPEKSKRKRKNVRTDDCHSIDEVDSLSTLSDGEAATRTTRGTTSTYFLPNDKTIEAKHLTQKRISDTKLEHQTLTSKFKYLKMSPGKKTMQHGTEEEPHDFETTRIIVNSPEQNSSGKDSKNKLKNRTSRAKSRNTKLQDKGKIVGMDHDGQRKCSSKGAGSNVEVNKNPVKSKPAVKRKSTASTKNVPLDAQDNDQSTKENVKQCRKDELAVNENKKKLETKTKKTEQVKTTRGHKTNKGGYSVKKKQCDIKKLSVMKAALPPVVDHSDVTAVLLHMEGPGMCPPSTSEGMNGGDDMMSSDDVMSSDGDGDTDEGEWEDVEDHTYKSPAKSQLPADPVEIMLEAPVIYKKRKKREFDWKAHVKRQMNKYQKNLLTDTHKVHLLCLITRGLYLNKLCLSEVLRAQAMSITGTTRELNIASVATCSTSHMTRIVSCIVGIFRIQREGDIPVGEDMVQRLQSSFQTFSVFGSLELALVCVILLRELGYLTRLVMSLQPLPLKTSSKGSKPGKLGNSAQSSKLNPSAAKTEPNSINLDEPKTHRSMKNRKNEKSSRGKRANNKSKTDRKNVTTSKSLDTGIEKEVTTRTLKTKNSARRSCASKISPNTYKETSEDLKDNSDDDFVPVDDIREDSAANDSDYFVQKDRRNSSGHKEKLDTNEEECSNNDFVEGRTAPTKTLARKLSGSQRKQQADNVPRSDSTCCDEWVEVYLQSEHKWVCVDCATGKLNQPYEMEQTATQPVTYILGFSRDGTIKDVTARYASQWLTSTKKLRVDADWWEETLSPYKCDDQHIAEQEDKDIQGHLIQRPLPTNMGAFKSHPLYVLRRHLLKFEAIYPDTAIPVGYIRGEPIYARECVHTLHSRENWLKEGQAVRMGEEAYKFVKSRPKWNKPKENPGALDLELFGLWQTELYIPPPAVDGKVPRNAHGNVEMFLPTMLPAGTVHLQIPALNRVAKKLDIDCAPAMVGWEQHCGFSHPLMDGWIVCEEFKDTLLVAWDEEQEIVLAREAEKREKRVVSNWRLLIRGLLIKERLKKRFDLEEEESQPSMSGDQSEKAADATQAWPRNRQTGRQTDHHTLCTVEKL